MTTSDAFWDKVAEKYAARPVADMDAYDRTIERTASYLNATDRVLEVGCGTGTTARRLAPYVASIDATDASGALIDIAKRRQGNDDAQNVTFSLAALDQGPEGPFDVVMAFNLLHLIKDIPAALDHLHAQIRPGGLLITKTGCLGSGVSMMRVAIWAARKLGKAPLVRFLDTADIEAMVEAAGFDIIETGNYPAKPISRFLVARKV